MPRAKTDKAFEALISDYGGLIHRIASTYELRPELIDELVQDTALAIWRALDHFRKEASVKSYIARITHNVCISHVRKAAIRPETPLEDIYADKAPQPDEITGKIILRQKLLSAVHQLDLPERQIISLYLEGFTQKESAEILGLTPSNVGVKLTRIRAKLKDLMDRQS